MRPMFPALKFRTINFAHFGITLVLNFLEGIEMNLSNRLAEIGNALIHGAPGLSNVAQDVGEAAAVIGAAMPGTSVATVASEVAGAANVATEVSAVVTGTTVTTPATAATAASQAEAEAAATAANVSAQATATAAQHETRLQAIESTMVELLPAVVALLQKFGQ